MIKKEQFRELFYKGTAEYTGKLYEEIYSSGESSSPNSLFGTESDVFEEMINIMMSSAKLVLENHEYIQEYNFKVENNDLQVRFMLANFKTLEQKETKEIEEGYIFTMSTGLKPNSSIDLLFIKESLKKLGWKINRLYWMYVENNNLCTRQFETTYTISDRFNYKNGKVKDQHYSTALIADLLSDGPITRPNIPKNVMAQRYLRRSYDKFNHAKDVAQNYLEWLLKEHNKKLPALSVISGPEEKVRRNDGMEWVYDNAIREYESVSKTFDYNDKQVSIVGPIRSINPRTAVIYDFETISMPFNVFDFTQVNQQVPMQYSVAYMECGQWKTKSNVYNFDSLKTEDYVKFVVQMVDDIYRTNSIYIAHNNNFENTALSRLLVMLDEYGELGTITKIESIIFPRNTIDTARVFKDKVIIRGLNGSYSIKYINKWIETNRPELNEQYGVKNYSSLDIGNGLEAQKVLTKMYFGLYGKEEKKQKINELIDYCNNDVLSAVPMIDLINETIEEFDEINKI